MIKCIGHKWTVDKLHGFFMSTESLSVDVLAKISEEHKSDRYIIAAPSLALSDKQLKKWHITVLKIGRDISPELFSETNVYAIIEGMDLACSRIETEKMMKRWSLVYNDCRSGSS